MIKKRSPGKARITSRVKDRNILRLARENPRAHATTIQRELVDAGETPPLPRTIRRRLQEAGLNGRVGCKKPLISPKNRHDRLE